MEWAQIFSSSADGERCRIVLERLGAFLGGSEVVTGSVAARLNLLVRGGVCSPGGLNDIDVVVEDGAVVSPKISESFLIHHYHPSREAGNVVVQLVEPETRTRLDVFSARSPTIFSRAQQADIHETHIRFAAAEDLAARLAAIVAIVCDGKTVDGKYLRSLRQMLSVSDRDLAAKLWSDYRRGHDPESFGEAVDSIESTAASCPDLLQPAVYATDLEANCQWCIHDAEFPIADPRQIFALLGHV